MIVELKDRYRFKVNDVSEIIDQTLRPILQFTINDKLLIAKINTITMTKELVKDNLTTIKIFNDDENIKEPLSIYTEYTKLVLFNKNVADSNISIALSVEK